MAEAAAARREARRRRILENSENRMQKIFGACKDNLNEEKSDDTIQSAASIDNGFISNKNSSSSDSQTLEQENHNILEEGSSCAKEEIKFSEPNVQYSEPDNHFAFTHSDKQYSLKRDTDCDNVNFYSTSNPVDKGPSTQFKFSMLSTLFFSPISCILLAVFVNILLLVDVELSPNKSIVTPYLILAVTRLCLRHNSDDQGNNMLISALILCNVKPGLVYSIKKFLDTFGSIPKDFAIYITSFVLFNWIVSILWTGSNYMQFL